MTYDLNHWFPSQPGDGKETARPLAEHHVTSVTKSEPVQASGGAIPLQNQQYKQAKHNHLFVLKSSGFRRGPDMTRWTRSAFATPRRLNKAGQEITTSWKYCIHWSSADASSNTLLDYNLGISVLEYMKCHCNAILYKFSLPGYEKLANRWLRIFNLI